MAKLTPQGIAEQLLVVGFERSGPPAPALSDPLVDTPMVVTLDMLAAYDHDPRVKRNPAYEDIKASILERGLDAPPAITRRPGEEHYIIRNGGNTRLAILRELWSATKDQQFFRIHCLFRPWPARGEIVALTGHLAENELRGGLTFIERALGVEKARGFYEQETGKALSQSELARRLSADGYPVQQSHISRMQEAVRYLLPAIPNLLYGGLGRHQVERLAVLRGSGERTWKQRAAGKQLAMDFETFFMEVLAPFDSQPEPFSAQRVQDELIGQMAEYLQLDYDTLALDLHENESRQRALTSTPAPMPPQPSASDNAAPALPATPPQYRYRADQPTTPAVPDRASAEVPIQHTTPHQAPVRPQQPEQLQELTVSPAPTTERLQSIQKLVAQQLGDELPDFTDNALKSIPVQAGGLYPISDIWYIDPGLDASDRLRIHIAQFAQEIAEEAQIAPMVEACVDGIGFLLSAPVDAANSDPAFALAVHTLLVALCDRPPLNTRSPALATNELAALLSGQRAARRLSDTALVKLFRLLRLARRLADLEPSRTARGS
ncbi:integrating conjugative element, PFGI_1 class, ParB family protein [Delftia tsuruhatensis]|uniref:ParB family protein n=1 Tax=Delftia tsuruhatensis TaxID=180282 RepID=UPI001E6A6B45|nr:ParB family protein [Delftia tsuruhatensis]CAB5670043.1 integrating conjugative element, PFGI_1 class, ParB family protein [Delftia tsuruhatensis]CAC9682930.1 integrating conjugative element, PFGI_1 class, ParB family protein [Delftia tsuruhatensis]